MPNFRSAYSNSILRREPHFKACISNIVLVYRDSMGYAVEEIKNVKRLVHK